MFKVYRNRSPSIERELFQLRNNLRQYNLRQLPQFDLPNVRSFFWRTESISFRGPKIWNIVPTEFKKGTSLDGFKKLIKNGNLRTVHVKLCKSFIQNLGFSVYIWLSLFQFTSVSYLVDID